MAFVDFFLAFGFVSVVASVAPAADVPEVAPGEPLPVAELPVALGELEEPEPDPVEPIEPVEPLPVVDEPDAPEPVLPDAPDDESLLPDPLEPVLPLAPDEPDVEDPGEEEDEDGEALEAPLLPDVPVSLLELAPDAPVALCDFVDDGSVALLLLDCASAMDDTDATTTSDNERRVFFNVISNSFELEKWHHRCSSLDATLARLFSSFQIVRRQSRVDIYQVLEFKDFLTM